MFVPGAIKLVLWPYTVGLTLVIMPAFHPLAFVQLTERYKITMSLIVPPVLLALVQHPAVEQYDISSIKLLVSGAAPLGAPLQAAVRERLSRLNGGKEVWVTQGMCRQKS